MDDQLGANAQISLEARTIVTSSEISLALELKPKATIPKPKPLKLDAKTGLLKPKTTKPRPNPES